MVAKSAFITEHGRLDLCVPALLTGPAVFAPQKQTEKVAMSNMPFLV